jgi:hypothetical protein
MSNTEKTVHLTLNEIHFCKKAIIEKILVFKKGYEDLDKEQQIYIDSIIEIHNNILNKLSVE